MVYSSIFSKLLLYSVHPDKNFAPVWSSLLAESWWQYGISPILHTPITPLYACLSPLLGCGFLWEMQHSRRTHSSSYLSYALLVRVPSLQIHRTMYIQLESIYPWNQKHQGYLLKMQAFLFYQNFLNCNRWCGDLWTFYQALQMIPVHSKVWKLCNKKTTC